MHTWLPMIYRPILPSHWPRRWALINDATVPEFWEVHELEFYWDSHWMFDGCHRYRQVSCFRMETTNKQQLYI